MDDFSGKFCKNGTFPVVRAMKTCLDFVATTTTVKTSPSQSENILTDETTEYDEYYFGFMNISTKLFNNYFLLIITIFIAILTI